MTGLRGKRLFRAALPEFRAVAGTASAVVLIALQAGCRTPEAKQNPASPQTRPAASSPAPDARTIVSNGGSFEVQYTSTPDPIPMNELFSLMVRVRPLADKPDAGGSLTFSADAAMPGHGHGMNTKPKVTALGEGRYRVEGMQFHMPGHWQLYFDIGTGSIIERAQADIHLE